MYEMVGEASAFRALLSPASFAPDLPPFFIDWETFEAFFL